MADFGTDIDRSWSANAQGDLKIVSGVDNAAQAVYNRLVTKLGELEQLGYGDYGNESHDEVGSTDLEESVARIEIYTKECLLHDPRVEDIEEVNVKVEDDTFIVSIDVYLIDEDNPNNFILKLGSGG